jgi:hypothetical protein
VSRKVDQKKYLSSVCNPLFILKSVIMRKFIVLTTTLVALTTCFASNSMVLPPKNSSDIFITHRNVGYKISLPALSRMKVKDFEEMTGKRMKLGEKIIFKIAQRKLRGSLNEYGNPDPAKIKKLLLILKHKYDSGDSHHWLMLTIFTLLLTVGLSIIGLFVPFVWVLAAITGLACAVFFILWLVSMAD